MSGGIGGLFSPDGPAPDPEVLARLSHALARRGPDGETLRTRAAVAMVHRALRLDGGRRGASLIERDNLLLTWDGRLDNRGELERALGAGIDGEEGDLALLARAWERWGEGFLERLVGDFALALWDGRRHLLLLARDPFATRPLFYAQRGGALLFASTLTALRTAWPLPAEVDDEWIASYLAAVRDVEGSPFRGLRSVPPGHCLLADAGGVRARRFWRLDPEREVRCRDDREYEELFRETFIEAVRCRLPEGGPAFAELSGGLDSSSIVCVADRLLRDGAVATPDLVPISEVYGRSYTADETPHIRLVEKHTGRPSHRLTEEECPILEGFEEPWFEVPAVLQAFLERHRRTLRMMRERGARVLLSGVGGDQLLRSQVGIPLDLADLARCGRFAELPAALRGWHEVQSKPYLQLLWQGLITPLLPRPLRRRLAPPLMQLPPWYDRGFARRMDLQGRVAAVGDERFRLPSRRLQSAMLELTVRTTAWRYDAGPEPRLLLFPFLHRPLVELCLAVPPDQLVRLGETRSLHRRALRGLLPPAIAERRDKRGPMEPILRAIAAQWPRLELLVRDARVCQRGYLDPAAFRRSLDEARFGNPDRKLLLLQVLALEVWLRQVEP